MIQRLSNSGIAQFIAHLEGIDYAKLHLVDGIGAQGELLIRQFTPPGMVQARLAEWKAWLKTKEMEGK